MIKKILVPLDASEYSNSAVEYACDLAKQHGASLTGLVVLNLVGVHKTIGRAPVGGSHYYKKLESHKINEAREHIENLQQAFARKCRKEKVKYFISRGEGSPSQQVLRDGRFHDLVVIGMKTHFRLGSSKETTYSSEQILEHSITPKYLIPSISGLRKKVNKVLVVMDSSQPSGRALQRFSQIALPTATETVRVVMATRKESEAQNTLDMASDLLKAHGFKKVRAEWISQKIKAALEDYLVDWADLIVTGPNQENEIINFKFSNFTKFLIKLGKKPLFIG